ncbi:aminopeptidase P family protein [Pedobacter deserti]|uniref:aminopeptidase P family protein n=1 Tax=Pedobacter deserti TaxID=2817382 RepID=UPI00210AB617|nr:aminopeptidase P family protein [Pedobacter sp. SYSU D00382]
MERLRQLREQMSADGVKAYIIPSADPHMSEYLPDHYKSIPYISGFSGSAGTLVVTHDFAGLWTDFRYFEQAEEQLTGSGFELVKQKVQHAPEYIQWLCDTLQKGDIVACDENLLSVLLGDLLSQQLSRKGLELQHRDYISAVWGDRPGLPEGTAYLVDDAYIGQTVASKLTAIREAIARLGADQHLISSLDDLAWTFNIRGNDVSYNPVVMGFALINQDHAKLFIGEGKLSEVDKKSLLTSGVEVFGYEEVREAIKHIPEHSLVLIDPKRSCLALTKLLPVTARIIKDTNPSTYLKAVKNETELINTRSAMLKDGVALTKFFKWLSETVGKERVTELSAAAKLHSFRTEQPGFLGDSFNTISAYRAHGALPHYGPTPESDVEVRPEGLFLVDSGGQYRYGTTDVTRTLPMGNNTEEERTDYTLVLKGMIDGCKARFPKGTCGYQIDAIARKPLWDHAINYGHGTGHGVGYFLNVHEGPHVFNATATPISIELGMITSIEPGIYRPGKHGIRIENLVHTVTDVSNEFGDFYAFECLTLAPISTRIVRKEIMSPAQIEWLNSYNAMVFERLSPFLNEDEVTWLKDETKAIGRDGYSPRQHT